VPVSLAGAAAAPDSGVPFRVTKHPVYLIAGLLPVSQPNLEDVLAGQTGTGTRIENLASGAEPLERPLVTAFDLRAGGACVGDVRKASS